MECIQTDGLSPQEFVAALNDTAYRQRIPLSGSIELTKRCNLRCRHCYLGDHRGRSSAKSRELSNKQWLAIIDEITQAGCLYLLITGGEPLLRRDFRDIYTHAVENGMLISLFTNGTLISEPVLDLLQELPPRDIEISLYGATAQTYETITGVKGSFQSCLEGIQLLLDRGLNVKLKTVLMTLNLDEFDAMEKMAKTFGVKFRFDPAIFPTMEGDKAPLYLRVDPEQAIAIEFSNRKRADGWRRFYEKFRTDTTDDRLYACGSGKTTFHISADGYLQPCIMASSYRF